MDKETVPDRIRLIACDIDNTLLPFGAEKISEENLRAIREAREAGIAFVLATGRQYSTAKQRVHEVNMPDMPVIAANGTDIRVGDKSIHMSCMDDETVRELTREISEMDLPVYLFCGDEILCVEKDERPDLFRVWTDEAGGVSPVRMLHSTEELLAEAEGNTQKMLSDVGEDLMEGTGDPVLHQKILSDLQHKYGDRADIACGGGLNIEINAPGVSKAEGLRYACDMLEIPVSQTMAIGDSGNDVDLLRAAGMGIAVGNAMDETKSAADVVTASSAENGVAQAIRKYALGEAGGA